VKEKYEARVKADQLAHVRQLFLLVAAIRGCCLPVVDLCVDRCDVQCACGAPLRCCQRPTNKLCMFAQAHVVLLEPSTFAADDIVEYVSKKASPSRDLSCFVRGSFAPRQSVCARRTRLHPSNRIRVWLIAWLCVAVCIVRTGGAHPGRRHGDWHARPRHAAEVSAPLHSASSASIRSQPCCCRAVPRC
jgi:hypothetical protein